MGQSPSIEAPKSQRVEADSHQNMVEIRFDHLAVGSTALLMIAVTIMIYLWCRRNRKHKSNRRGCPFTPAPTRDPGYSLAPWHVYRHDRWQPPTPHPKTVYEMIEMRGAIRPKNKDYDHHRFTELPRTTRQRDPEAGAPDKQITRPPTVV